MSDMSHSTVRMWRDGKHADVHPDEEANYAAYGWTRDGGEPEPAAEPDPVPDEAPEPVVADEPEPEAADDVVSVYRVVDGERNERASRARLTRVEAEAYVAARPGTEYVVVVDED